MNTKLTLTLEKEVIEKAKEFAARQGQSLSSLVENYFKLLTFEHKEEPKKNPNVRRRTKVKVQTSEEKPKKNPNILTERP